MDGLKDVLMEKVPIDVRATPEFKTLLSFVKKEKIKTVSELKSRIESHLKKEEEWFKKNKGSSVQGTMNRWLRMHIKHYDFLKVVKKKILTYL